MLVCYQLYTSLLVSTVAAATLNVVRAGRIVGIQMMSNLSAGAGTGSMHSTVDLNQVGFSFATTNNPLRSIVLARHVNGGNNTTSAIVGAYVPLDLPVVVGDVLAINMTAVGTGLGTHQLAALIWVNETG